MHNLFIFLLCIQYIVTFVYMFFSFITHTAFINLYHFCRVFIFYLYHIHYLVTFLSCFYSYYIHYLVAFSSGAQFYVSSIEPIRKFAIALSPGKLTADNIPSNWPQVCNGILIKSPRKKIPPKKSL